MTDSVNKLHMKYKNSTEMFRLISTSHISIENKKTPIQNQNPSPSPLCDRQSNPDIPRREYKHRDNQARHIYCQRIQHPVAASVNRSAS